MGSQNYFRKADRSSAKSIASSAFIPEYYDPRRARDSNGEGLPSCNELTTAAWAIPEDNLRYLGSQFAPSSTLPTSYSLGRGRGRDILDGPWPSPQFPDLLLASRERHPEFRPAAKLSESATAIPLQPTSSGNVSGSGNVTAFFPRSSASPEHSTSSQLYQPPPSTSRSSLPNSSQRHDFVFESGNGTSSDLRRRKPKRRMNLDQETRLNAKVVRKIGACWRCRLLRNKVCDSPPSV